MSQAQPEIRMRPFASADAPAMTSWASTADELLQWAGPIFRFPLDESQLLEYARDTGDQRHLICAARSSDDTVLGHVELKVLAEHSLGKVGRVAVDPSLRGQGIAGRMLGWLVRFAFEDLCLHRLELVVFAFNRPALRCYERLGFCVEGRARDARKASEGYWDLLYMGMLESDYRAASASPLIPSPDQPQAGRH